MVYSGAVYRGDVPGGVHHRGYTTRVHHPSVPVTAHGETSYKRQSIGLMAGREEMRFSASTDVLRVVHATTEMLTASNATTRITPTK